MYTNIARFEWDSDKARSNSVKHGVGFEEASTAFFDPEGLVAEDRLHSLHEDRQCLIGESAQGRVLLVVFTVRPGPSIRIISARLAGPRERMGYEER